MPYINDLQAQKDWYNGIEFRSKLESKTAQALDNIGIRYEYEPEGFELPSGKRYLPDFRVECWGKRGDYSGPPFDLYIEVKGHMKQKDAKKIKEFVGKKSVDVLDSDGNVCYCIDVPENPTLIVGNIPVIKAVKDTYDFYGTTCSPYDDMDGTGIYQFNYETVDGDHFGAYPAVHNGRFYLWGDDSNYINKEDAFLVASAYRLAQQARFEYGETPKPKRRSLYDKLTK